MICVVIIMCITIIMNMIISSISISMTVSHVIICSSCIVWLSQHRRHASTNNCWHSSHMFRLTLVHCCCCCYAQGNSWLKSLIVVQWCLSRQSDTSRWGGVTHGNSSALALYSGSGLALSWNPRSEHAASHRTQHCIWVCTCNHGL